MAIAAFVSAARYSRSNMSIATPFRHVSAMALPHMHIYCHKTVNRSIKKGRVGATLAPVCLTRKQKTRGTPKSP